MTDLLPWIIILIIVALAAGYVLGRKATTRAAPSTAAPNHPVAAGLQTVANRPTSQPLAAKPAVAPASRPASSDAGAVAALANVKSWGYQLQHLKLDKAAASPYDLLVIDYARDGSDDTALKPAELDRLKRKPDGSRRLVIAYLSIGEAESYRFYWQNTWKKQKPAWLLGENPEWEENYSVCFWDPGWQQLMCGNPQAYLDRIIAQGFDGIYLDKCDVTEDLKRHFKAAAKSRPDLDADMVAFVQRLSAYAKAKRPGFVIIMQNAEPLLERPALRAAVDAMGKEELLFGLDSPERPNTKGEIAYSRDLLDLMKDEGKPILMVEYLDNPAKIRAAAAEAKRLGYVLYVAPKDRELDRLTAAPPVA
ncbi:MAG: MJ1477/TM1410 family putative glycoside hydrolase [Hyphomicrobiaceae bacterium]